MEKQDLVSSLVDLWAQDNRPSSDILPILDAFDQLNAEIKTLKMNKALSGEIIKHWNATHEEMQTEIERLTLENSRLQRAVNLVVDQPTFKFDGLRSTFPESQPAFKAVNPDDMTIYRFDGKSWRHATRGDEVDSSLIKFCIQHHGCTLVYR